VLDTNTVLQLTPPKYKVTYLTTAPAAQQQQQQQQQGSLAAVQLEQLLIEQAVAAAAAFRAVAAQASGSSIAGAGAATANGSSSGAINGDVHGPWKPFMAPLLVNDRVTSEDHFQETRHLEFDLSASGLHYQPGDLLTIFPRTPAADVEVWFVFAAGCVGAGGGQAHAHPCIKH
jgi:sulfite reductase alpha subunit-like flavoprotein